MLSLSLNGCSWLFGNEGIFPTRAHDYLDAKESPPLTLPEGVEIDEADDEYPVPQLNLSQLLPEQFAVPRVEPLVSIEQKGSVRIQRLADQQWLLVNAAAGETWPLIVNFLNSNQIPIDTEDGVKGLIETGWLRQQDITFEDSELSEDAGKKIRKKSKNDEQDDADLSSRERYRFLIKAGVQKETTEIYVLQFSSAEANEKPQSIGWAAGSSSVARETNMAELLAAHLANRPQQPSHSLLAQGIGSASKVSLEYDQSGLPFLALQLPFDRAWASLALALEKSSYTVDDLDRSQGIYYVRDVKKTAKEKRPGFIKRLLSRKSEAEREAERGEHYQIKTQYNNQILQINIHRERTPVLKSNEQAFLLKRIQLKLS